MSQKKLTLLDSNISVKFSSLTKKQKTTNLHNFLNKRESVIVGMEDYNQDGIIDFID